jgi:hypothetical protein
MSYDSRLPQRHIRLLQLHPGQFQDPIHCNLRECHLDDALPYEALSYVWGDPSAQVEIKCQNISVAVNVNLGLALRHLRHADGSRWLWVDAICINQQDLEERADQVKLMRNVYVKAAAVLIWLGEDEDEGCAPALELMNAVCEAYVVQAQASSMTVLELSRAITLSELPPPSIEAVQAMIDSLAVRADAWQHLRKLFSREWFNRTWCVQEAVLATTAVVHVGRVCFPWETLGVTASWLNQQEILTEFALPPVMANVPYYNCFCMFDGIVEDDQLVDILHRFRAFASTDPRDKVYGLLGLVKNGEGDVAVDVDYGETSVSDVYTDLAAAYVELQQNLAILSFVKHRQDLEADLAEGVPSWVPLWSVDTDTAMIYSKHYPYEACGLNDKVKLEPALPKSLSPVGLLFSEVDAASMPMTMSLFSDPHKDRGQPEATPTIISDLWHEVSASDDPITDMLRMAQNLTAGLDKDYRMVNDLEDDERMHFYGDFGAWIAHHLTSRGLDSATFPPQSISSLENDAGSFKIAASRACDQRRVFRTRNGFRGIGPTCMAAGDRIVVLRGGQVPFVLRPSGSAWLFMGECFVAGIMNGETFEDSIDGWARPGERPFHLI